MKILIIGGSGALGSDLKRILIQGGNSVRTLGRSSSNDFAVDLTKKITEIDYQTDIIINCAGIVHNRLHASKFDEKLIHNDLKISQGVCIIAKRLKPKLFLNISSVSVYGINKGSNIDENHPKVPNSGYGFCKLSSENLFLSLTDTSVINLRLPLIITTRKTGNILRLHNQISKGLFFKIHAEDCIKCLVYPEDIAMNIDKFLKLSTGNYNFYSKQVSFIELINSLESKYNKELMTIPLSIIVFIKRLLKIFDFIAPIKSTVNSIEKVIYPLTFSKRKISNQINLEYKGIKTLI